MTLMLLMTIAILLIVCRPTGFLTGLSSRAIIGEFYEKFEGTFDKSWVSKVGMLIQSNQESETYKWLGQVPGMREWVGERLAKGLRVTGQTITNKKFEQTLEFDSSDLRRDKTGQVQIRIRDLADRASDHWASLLSTLLLNGDGATSGLAYDGQYFFDTDHRYVGAGDDGGAQKNLLTSSEVASLNITTATAPTQAEAAIALLDSIAYMYGFLDDQGEPINQEARSFIVTTGVGLWGAFTAAASASSLLAASGAVIPSPLAGTGLQIAVVCNPRLNAWTDKFAILRVDGNAKPFILQEETKLKVTMLGEGSEHEQKTGKQLFMTDANRNVGYGLWQHAVRCTLS